MTSINHNVSNNLLYIYIQEILYDNQIYGQNYFTMTEQIVS